MQADSGLYCQKVYIIETQAGPDTLGRLRTESGSKMWYTADQKLKRGACYRLQRYRLDSTAEKSPLVRMHVVDEVTDP